MNFIMLVSLVLILTGTVTLLLTFLKLNRQKKLASFNVKLEGERNFNWLGLIHFFNGIFSSDPKEIQKKFLAAGFYDNKFSKYFVVVKYGVLCLGAIGILVLDVFIDLPQSNFIVAESVWLISVLMGPDTYLAMRAKSLRHTISNKLPYMLDLMAVCVQTGMTIEAAISYLAQEFGAFDKDLSHLLRKVDERARVVGLEQSLQELYARVPTNEVRSFVMTLNQSLQYGSSIYSVLTTLSADIREVQLLHVEEKIGQLSARMSIPLIIFIMVPIVILIAAPGIMRLLQHAHF
ncbi:type II secretion system F family protein [Vibrio nitrifigilis]|uniref:Type II secretion system F family protein n=1 Tax=Vibrio nitrifigilis TaxID=2789781 RepID=A0ABS0GIW0_9VIBR|nr:type II secretion system F family protein [Vibrio nitrifigilis]MBF9002230.1 type II secretion system F family protein [Vibrio nitrifigilis]